MNQFTSPNLRQVFSISGRRCPIVACPALLKLMPPTSLAVLCHIHILNPGWRTCNHHWCQLWGVSSVVLLHTANCPCDPSRACLFLGSFSYIIFSVQLLQARHLTHFLFFLTNFPILLLLLLLYLTPVMSRDKFLFRFYCATCVECFRVFFFFVFVARLLYPLYR